MGSWGFRILKCVGTCGILGTLGCGTLGTQDPEIYTCHGTFGTQDLELCT